MQAKNIKETSKMISRLFTRAINHIYTVIWMVNINFRPHRCVSFHRVTGTVCPSIIIVNVSLARRAMHFASTSYPHSGKGADRSILSILTPRFLHPILRWICNISKSPRPYMFSLANSLPRKCLMDPFLSNECQNTFSV